MRERIVAVAAVLTLLVGCPSPPQRSEFRKHELNGQLRLGDYRYPDEFRDIDDQLHPRDETGPDDAGDYSFVRQMMPALFGRKVRGYEELRLLADVLRESGGDRAAFMRLLLNGRSPYHVEYAEFWSDTLLNRLRLQRDGDKGAMRGCFAESDPPRVRPGDGSPAAIAICILQNPPTGNCSVQGAFNMLDVVRSAVVLDNLSVAYRAYLFPLVNFTTVGDEVTPFNEQDEVAETFQHVYLHRNRDCLACHNSMGSVTGEFDLNLVPTYWNRHYPVPGNFETALFGAPTGRDLRQTNEAFRSSIRSDLNPQVPVHDRRPWGMGACGAFRDPGSVDADARYPAGFTPAQAYLTAPLPANASVWELEQLLNSGIEKLSRFGLRRDRLFAPSTVPAAGCTDHCESAPVPAPAIPIPPMEVSTIVATNCATMCHVGPTPNGNLNLEGANWAENLVSQPVSRATSVCTSYQYRVVPGQPERSCLAELVTNGIMPPWGLSQSDRDRLIAWIDTELPEGAGCDPEAGEVCLPVAAEETDNDAALAYLLAMNIVSETWTEVMGNPLTIANYFPRNESQRDILQNLTENVFLARGWSLQSLLVAILASEHFNRRTPAATNANFAHVLQPHHKPFEVNDPRRPPEAVPGWTPGGPAPVADLLHALGHMRHDEGRSRHLNAMSDAIYRYSADNLLNSVHRSLLWPAAPVAPVAPGGGYPDTALRKNIGQFFSDVESGFRGVNFQSLIAWESAHGRCRNPGTAPDWVTAVIERARTTPGVTYRDLAITVRDWLLSNGNIDTLPAASDLASEEALINTLFGGSDAANVLDTAVDLSTDTRRTEVGDLVRDLCGMMVESPQFLLAGLADEELGPQPTLRECGSGPCSYVEYCRTLIGAAESELGVDLSCSDDCVVVEDIPPTPEIFCGHRSCEGVPDIFVVHVDDCLLSPDPMDCLPIPPPCEIGCDMIDCCGGPGPPLEDPTGFLGLADNGIVARAEGATLIRRGSGKAIPLEKGTTLKYGDLVRMPAGSHVLINAPGGVFKTPPQGVPRTAERGWTLLVTANPDRAQRRVQMIPLPPSRAWIDTALRAPDAKLPRRMVEFIKQPEDPARIRKREQQRR